FGSAGDRTNDILHRLGYTAARGADQVGIAHLDRYLRGRDPEDLARRLQAGVIDGGKPEAPVFPNEREALEWMLTASRPNDVIAALWTRLSPAALMPSITSRAISPRCRPRGFASSRTIRMSNTRAATRPSSRMSSFRRSPGVAITPMRRPGSGPLTPGAVRRSTKSPAIWSPCGLWA